MKNESLNKAENQNTSHENTSTRKFGRQVVALALAGAILIPATVAASTKYSKEIVDFEIAAVEKAKDIFADKAAIPDENGGTIVVNKGDTLWTIVDDIKAGDERWNDVDKRDIIACLRDLNGEKETEFLQIGQTLRMISIKNFK